MTRSASLTDPDRPGSEAMLEDALFESVAPVQLSASRKRALRERLFARVHAASDQGFVNLRSEDGEWRQLLKGVRVKMLCEGPGARSVLVDLEPGASLPTHRHREHEECVVLRGEADLGSLHVRRGDYHLAPARSRHGRVSSRTGALLYLRGTPIGDSMGVARDLVTAWLPGRRIAPITIRADEGQWRNLAPGVRSKTLWRDGDAGSMLMELARGACIAAHAGSMAEECLVLDGEASFGDVRLTVGEHQLAPASTPARELASATGALIYIHGALEYARAAA